MPARTSQITRVGKRKVELSNLTKLLFPDDQIVKAQLMRVTLHAVAASDYPSLHEAMQRTLRGARLNDRRFRSEGLTPDEADALQPCDLFVRLSFRVGRFGRITTNLPVPEVDVSAVHDRETSSNPRGRLASPRASVAMMMEPPESPPPGPAAAGVG